MTVFVAAFAASTEQWKQFPLSVDADREGSDVELVVDELLFDANAVSDVDTVPRDKRHPFALIFPHVHVSDRRTLDADALFAAACHLDIRAFHTRQFPVEDARREFLAAGVEMLFRFHGSNGFRSQTHFAVRVGYLVERFNPVLYGPAGGDFVRGCEFVVRVRQVRAVRTPPLGVVLFVHDLPALGVDALVVGDMAAHFGHLFTNPAVGRKLFRLRPVELGANRDLGLALVVDFQLAAGTIEHDFLLRTAEEAEQDDGQDLVEMLHANFLQNCATLR